MPARRSSPPFPFAPACSEPTLRVCERSEAGAQQPGCLHQFSDRGDYRFGLYNTLGLVNIAPDLMPEHDILNGSS